MKKLQNLGRSLSKEEQKMISGGAQLVCTCNGSDMETVVCAFSSIVGLINCTASAGQYCTGLGYGGISCLAGNGPQQ